MSELEKEMKAQVREKTYRTYFNVDIQTSRERTKTRSEIGKKSFCYNTFVKGELRPVCSTTYCLTPNSDQYYIKIADTSQSNVLIRRGDEIHEEKRLQVTMIRGKEDGKNCYT